MANFFFAKFSLSGCCPGPLSPEFVDGRAVFWNMSEIERLIPVGRRGGWRGGDRQSILKTSTGCGTCPAGARRAHAYMKRWLISDSVRGAELGLVSISLVNPPGLRRRPAVCGPCSNPEATTACLRKREAKSSGGGCRPGPPALPTALLPSEAVRPAEQRSGELGIDDVTATPPNLSDFIFLLPRRGC